MKVAIASSGLGHVARGIETWAMDSAVALSQLSGLPCVALSHVEGAKRGCRLAELLDKNHEEHAISVTLFCGAEVSEKDEGGNLKPERNEHRTAIVEQGVFGISHRVSSTERRASSSGFKSQVLSLEVVVLPCLKRGDLLAQRLARLSPAFAWRWGMTSPYGWEQVSFWWRLWPILRRERFDILHVQDPVVADWCRRFKKIGLVKTEVVLAHGTEESPEFLARFDFVQHLAPWHAAQEAESGKRKAESGELDHAPCAMRSARSARFCIPNFVDVRVFRPAASAERRERKRDLGIPEDAFVIGTVAAVKKSHKRIDYLVREFARLPGSGNGYLLLAGARMEESDAILRGIDASARGRVKVEFDLPRERMPAIFGAMDLFVLTSLFEMMPIALIEAMASGLPVIVNRHPVLEWIVGKGGSCIDMAAEGALAAEIEAYAANVAMRMERGAAARERVEKMFSKDVVIRQMMEMYEEVQRSGC